MLVLELDLRADRDRAALRRLLVHEHRAVETIAQERNSPLEQALVVLRGVVLEVLGEVAEPPGGLDRLDGSRAARAFELGELGLQLRLLSLGQRLGFLAGHRASLAIACYGVSTGRQWGRPCEMSFSFLLRAFRGRQVSNPKRSRTSCRTSPSASSACPRPLWPRSPLA